MERRTVWIERYAYVGIQDWSCAMDIEMFEVMLRGYVLNLWGSWIDRVPLVKFVNDNLYGSSTEMTSNEAMCEGPRRSVCVSPRRERDACWETRVYELDSWRNDIDLETTKSRVWGKDRRRFTDIPTIMNCSSRQQRHVDCRICLWSRDSKERTAFQVIARWCLVRLNKNALSIVEM